MRLPHILLSLLIVSGPAVSYELIGDQRGQREMLVKRNMPDNNVDFNNLYQGTIGANNIQSLQLPWGDPIWEIAQWNSNSSLCSNPVNYFGYIVCSNYSGQVNPDGSSYWATADKRLQVGGSGYDMEFAIDAYNEHGGTFVNYWNGSTSQRWPHLLVEQGFDDEPGRPGAPFMDEPDLKLLFKASARLTYSSNMVNQSQGGVYIPGSHTAQFLIHFTVQNLKPGHSEYEKYYWYGISLYDERYAYPPAFNGSDFGVNIYYVPTSLYANQTTHTGSWVDFELDLYPHMIAGLQQIFPGDDMGNFKVSSINMGWEVTGLNVSTMRIRNLSLNVSSRNFPAWEFNTGSIEGWTYQHMTQQYGGPYLGRWYFSANSNDPMLTSKALQVDSAKAGTVIVSMANDGNPNGASTMQLFFQSDSEPFFSEDKSFFVNVPNDGGWREYAIQTAEHPKWAGTITRLRLDPVFYGNGGWVGFDYIRVAP